MVASSSFDWGGAYTGASAEICGERPNKELLLTG